MSKTTYLDRKKELNRIMTDWANLYKVEAAAFIRVAMKRGATIEELAKEAGYTGQALGEKYRQTFNQIKNGGDKA